MGKADTPPAPDYYGLAQQQGQIQSQLLNQQTTANRPDQVTPWGSTNWSQDPQGNWTEEQSLNPTEQATLDAQQKLNQGATGAAGNLFNSAGFGKGLSGIPDVKGGNYYTPEAQNAVWDQFTSMQKPLQDQQTEQQMSQLYAQGLRPGDKAYDDAARNLSNTQSQQTQQAMDQAVLAGEQEAQTMQGMDVQANNSNIQKILSNYNLFNGLRGSPQSSLNMPGFSQAGGQTAPDLMGAANNLYGAQLNSTNASNAQTGQTESGLMTMAMLAMMM
jgi:hypothetical protein